MVNLIWLPIEQYKWSKFLCPKKCLKNPAPMHIKPAADGPKPHYKLVYKK